MLVLGIDPGSRILGYGLVETRANQVFHVASGVVRVDGRAPLPQRLKGIFSELKQLVHAFQPDAVAVEGVFTHKNARSALILGHARGVVLLLAAQEELEVFEYAPARVKKSIGAGGNDSKDAVARMVERLLLLPKPLQRADAYDALAVALCHIHQLRLPRALGARGQSQKSSAAQRSAAVQDFFARLRPAVGRVGA